jgi:uncharacterized protein (DUF1697 family)
VSAYVALLRAVNLPGHNKIGMADLRDLVARLGFTGAQSLLQSGNLLFRAAAASSAQLEQRLEDEAGRRLGLKTDFFVRSAPEWKRIVAGNPFSREAADDPGHLVMMCLKSAPGRDQVTTLERAIKGRETVRVKGQHAYIVYPDGIGRSKLTTLLIEKCLGTRGTGRNWNTVLKLALAAEEIQR